MKTDLSTKLKNHNFFIAGFEPLTLNDFPGKTACIIFLAGCNLRCRYCHNPELVLPVSIQNRFEDVKNFIYEKNVSNVVITGGEPLFYKDIENLSVWLKSHGLNIKLDTNGSFPSKLKKLSEKQLFDFVSVDIKALNDEDFQKITRVPAKFSNLIESIDVLNQFKIPYELRYTKWKEYSDEEWEYFYNISKSNVKIKEQNIRLNQKILDKTFSVNDL